jgi:hypothetical protein
LSAESILRPFLAGRILRMSLDKNLFTLNFTPNGDDPAVLDLVDPSGTVHYHKQRVAGNEYKMNVYGKSSRSKLRRQC